VASNLAWFRPLAALLLTGCSSARLAPPNESFAGPLPRPATAHAAAAVPIQTTIAAQAPVPADAGQRDDAVAADPHGHALAWARYLASRVDERFPFNASRASELDIPRATEIIGSDGLWLYDVNWKKPQRFSQPEFASKVATHADIALGRLLHIGAVFRESIYTPSPVYHLTFVETSQGFQVIVPGIYRFTFIGDHAESRLTAIEYLQNEAHE
jgi:hypothetical protein